MTADKQVFEFSGFRLDANQRLLFDAEGEPLALTSRAFDTLLFMIEHPGELLDRETMMRSIWPGTIVEENNLSQCIVALRRTLGESPEDHKFIVTVPGRGYRFVAPVKLISGDTEGTPTDAGAALAPETGAIFGASRFVFVAAVLAIVALLGASLTLWQRARAPATGASMPSIAVLPFADMSPNKDQEYFADGLSEELSNRLAHLSGLRVIGRTSSFAFKGKNEDLRKIGEILGVDRILEGSVRKSGDRVRVTAQLIDTADGSHIWSQTYERTLSDIFAIQDDIAKEVTRSLQISIGALDLDKGGTKNFEAYDAYLAGNAQQYQSGANNVLMGISDLERAVQIDPKFVQAWSALYNLYRQAALTFGAQAEEWLTNMAQVGDRVLALAPGSPTANLVLADRAFFAGEFTEAGRLLRSIGDLPYNLSQQGHLEYCLFLFGMGRALDSVDCHKQMVQTDPLSVIASMNLQAGYEVIGSFDHAKAENRRALSFASDTFFLNGTALTWALSSGDPDEVKRVLRSTLGNAPSEQSLDAVMVRLIDMPDVARRELRRRIDNRKASKNILGLGILAQWAAYFGDPQLALEALRKSQRQPDLYSLWTMWRPLFKNVRRLPGFKQLVRDEGLVDYWRESGNWGDFCRPVGDDDFECS